MKLRTHLILQVLGFSLQGANQVLPLLSSNGKFWATVVISAVQLGMAILGHLSDQQGNPLPPIKK
jgi:hypothetical protein